MSTQHAPFNWKARWSHRLTVGIKFQPSQQYWRNPNNWVEMFERPPNSPNTEPMQNSKVLNNIAHMIDFEDLGLFKC